MEKIFFFRNILKLFSIYTSYIFMALLKFICRSLMECQKKSIENTTKSDSNFAPTFVDYYSLPDISFNGYYLIKKNISTSKKAINL